MPWSLVTLTFIFMVSMIIHAPARAHPTVFGSSSGLDHYGMPFQRQNVVEDLDAGIGMRSSDQLRAAVSHEGPSSGRENALSRFAETRVMKTGTTIAGVVFEGGVVLGADTRATGGKTVCDRNCDKIHILASNIACCGAGTSADAVRVTKGVRIALLRMANEMQACLPSMASQASRQDEKGKSIITRDHTLEEVQRRYLRVSAAAFLLKRHLFRHQGTVSAALVLGGVDSTGTHLYQIHEGGSFAEVELTAMGSGSLAALSALEGGYRAGLTEQEAKELVLSAISAGITNDLGSGSNVDLCVITDSRGLEHLRGARTDVGSQGDSAWHDRQGECTGEMASSQAEVEAGMHVDTSSAGAATSPTIRIWRETSGKSFDRLHGDRVANVVDSDDTAGAGLDESGYEIDGEGGSRAWVGSVRRRGKDKRVVRVNMEKGTVEQVRCSALDDKIEVL